MESIEEMYQEHAQTVYKYLMTLAKNPDVAEELTQETFYQAMKSIRRYDNSCKITTWLCAIAKNVFFAYQRKHPAMKNVDELQQPVSSVEYDVIKKADRVQLMQALHKCAEPYREVLYLRVFGNLSFKEIGEVMGKTENWARVTFYRGKERVRKEFVQDEK